MGICLLGLSWVPISVSNPVHTGFVQILGVAVLALSLWCPFGYYNLTALELSFAGIILAWLVVLIRTLDAMIADR